MRIKVVIVFIILSFFYCLNSKKIAFGMTYELFVEDNSEKVTYKYSWGTASAYMDDSTLFIKNGVITDRDDLLWPKLSREDQRVLRQIVFENVTYEGSMNKLFAYSSLSAVETVDFSGLDTTQVTSMEELFANVNKKLSTVTFGDEISATSKIESTKKMFNGCPSLKTINLNGLDLTNNVNMEGMFYQCDYLEILTWDNVNTSNVVTMKSTFESCRKLSNIDISRFDTKNVTTMENMFFNCEELTDFFPIEWDTSKVQTMQRMFYFCYKLKKVNINGWDNQPSLKSTRYMFNTNRALETLEIKNFDTRSVTNMEGMFVNCTILRTLDVSSFDTRNVTDYTNMFRSMRDIEELNISNFDTSNAEKLDDMLAYTINLQRITLGRNSFFNTTTALSPIKGEVSVVRPTSWVSIKNFKTYDSTTSFLNDYSPIENDEDTFVRGYPFTIQYYDQITNRLLHEQIEVTNEEFLLQEYSDHRRSINSWTLNGEILSFENYYSNLGIEEVGTTPEKNKVTQLFSHDIEDVEAEVTVFWYSNESDTQYINQDKSLPIWEDTIYFTPSIDLDEEVADEQAKYIDYKVEIIDSDKNRKIQDLIVTTVANETNEIKLNLDARDLENTENISINFYQLSFSEINIEDKIPITEAVNAQLFIEVSIFTSFKITNYPSLLKWEFSKSNSIGIVERTSDNLINLEILNSKFEKESWRVNLQVNAATELPFRFIWKSNGEDTGKILDIGQPIPITNNKDAQTDDHYNYYSNWTSDCGLLIESNTLIKPGTYGEDISILWILENSPDFS